MSSYYQYTKHPKTGKWELAMWIDDWFKHYHYGVSFPSDPIDLVYDPHKVKLEIGINEEEARILNEHKERKINE